MSASACGPRSPSTFLCAARDADNGEEALKQIRERLPSDAAKRLRFHQLDITSDESVKKFYKHLLLHHEGVDILVNNAATAPEFRQKEAPMANSVDETMTVNYYGTRRVFDTFFPIFKAGAR